MGGGLHPVDGWLAKNSAYCSGVWRMTTTPPPGSGLLPIVIEMVPMRVPMATSSPVTATMSFDKRDMGGGYPPTLGLWKWDRFPAAGWRAPPHRSSRPAAGTLLVPRRLLSARVAHPPTAGEKRWSRGEDNLEVEWCRLRVAEVSAAGRWVTPVSGRWHVIYLTSSSLLLLESY